MRYRSTTLQSAIEHYRRVIAELGGTMELVEVHDVLVGAQLAVAWVEERAVPGSAP